MQRRVLCRICRSVKLDVFVSMKGHDTARDFRTWELAMQTLCRDILGAERSRVRIRVAEIRGSNDPVFNLFRVIGDGV